MTSWALYIWVLQASTAVTDGIGKGPNHHLAQICGDGARAIAEGCLATPMFEHDDGRHCGAVLVEMCGRESGCDNTLVGDNHHAFGAFQTHYPQPYTAEELMESWDRSVEVAIRMLRDSIRKCPEYPLAPYARGWCGSLEGRAISRERWAEAKQIFQIVPVDLFDLWPWLEAARVPSW